MKLHRFLSPFIILVVVAILSMANYVPGTYLSGWDTLHPEFNFSLYVQRIVYGSWQFHQGLGAASSQAHVGELPRMVILAPLITLLPDSLVRYSFFYLTLIVGSLGMYYCSRRVLNAVHSSSRSINELIALFSSLFYILNIGTLQFYYFPFEMFASLFALLPWILLVSSQFVSQDSNLKKTLVCFVILALFAGPVGHTPTLFYAFYLCFAGYILVLGWHYKRTGLYRALLLLAILFISNSYWILPNMYFLITYGGAVAQSKIHSMFSFRAFSISREFSTVPDIITLKNFYFDWGNFDSHNRIFVEVFNEWNKHFQSVVFKFVQIFFAGLFLLGIGSQRRRTHHFSRALLVLLFIPVFFIGNKFFLFRPFFSLFQEDIPLFQEAFRFPFTKFGLMFIVVYTLYLALGLQRVFLWIVQSSQIHRKLITIGMLVGMFVLLLYYMLPAFQGGFISSHMKVKIPDYYFDMFDYFNQKSEYGRVAYFPVHTYWGWVYHNWGYEGAGFLWFGLKQPILMREFDRWHPANENFYWEVSNAVYAKNMRLLENVLRKYDVTWLVIDRSVIAPDNPKSAYFEQLRELFESSETIDKDSTFGSIDIYRLSTAKTQQQWKSVVEETVSIAPAYSWNNYDEAFTENGNYTTHFTDYQPELLYPFRSLFTDRKQEEQPFKISESADEYIITPRWDRFRTMQQFNLENFTITLPDSSDELLFIDQTNLTDKKLFEPTVQKDSATFAVHIPKIGGLYSYNSESDSARFNQAVAPCDQSTEGQINRFATDDNLLRFTARNASNCIDIDLPNLTQRLSYVIRIDSRNSTGKSFLFRVINMSSDRSEIETYLPNNDTVTSSYFILPPLDLYGIGYKLHFDNLSLGSELTSNDLGAITVQPFPYRYLSGIKLHSIVKKKTTPLLFYSQSFDPGWVAYQTQNSKLKTQNWLAELFPPLFGKQLTEHVLVNNWANGWVLPSEETQNSKLKIQNETTEQTVKIIFWPQYLEYIGFGLLILSFLYLLRYHRK